jgi:hypothetical protein
MSAPIRPQTEHAAAAEMLDSPQHPLRTRAVVPAVMGAVAFVALLPMFHFGIASGHDFEFHVNSWMEVVRQWRQGLLYPRWAEMANFGFGEPRFIFYPPASWMLGGALGMILPWKLVPGAYLWVVLTASGCSMFALASRYLAPRDAIFASAFYVVNPYHLLVVYWRSAFAELMAASWMPLLVLLVLQLRKGDNRSMLRLAAVMAAVWLTNLPAAVMATYSLVLMVGVLAYQRRSLGLLLHGAMAGGFGILATSFYLLPAAYERRWVTIQQALDPIVRPGNNFLFTLMNDVMHNRFNRLVSIIAVLEICVLILAGWLLRRRQENGTEPRLLLIAWGTAATLLMLPITWALWQYLPELRYVQLPWRWLLCLNVAIAMLLTFSVRQWLIRVLIYLMLVLAVIAVWRWVQPPWWDKAADLTKMLSDIEQERGYESVSEYMPLAANLENAPEKPPRIMTEDEPTSMQVNQWKAEEKILRVDAAKPSRLELRLFAYPAWQVEVNGRRIQYESDQDIGQVIVPVPKGETQVRVFLTRTWDRTLGASISAFMLGIACVLWFAGRPILSPAS